MTGWSSFEGRLWSVRILAIAAICATGLHLLAYAIWSPGFLPTPWLDAYRLVSFATFLVLLLLLTRLTKGIIEVGEEDRKRGFRTWLFGIIAAGIVLMTLLLRV